MMLVLTNTKFIAHFVYQNNTDCLIYVLLDTTIQSQSICCVCKHAL